MSTQRPSRISLPPATPVSPSPGPTPDNLTSGGGGGRAVSFSASRPRRQSASRWRQLVDDESGLEPAGPPPIPSAVQPAGDTTPLPMLSMIVLSITMLGEFLSANVSTPFILDMVAGFPEFKNDASAAAAWTGVLVSMFFLTQFATSLLWATIADKYGQRTVLFTSLLGGAFTCAIFGTASSLREAVAIRLLQGVFAGAIGVARGGVPFITDPSNEGRAYAILGFCWGFGGVAGAIVGGSFESPAKKWPGVFSNIKLFVDYPYLLPTLVAASVTATGAFLSLLLGRDGGPRGGAIRLPEKSFDLPETIVEEDEETSLPTSPMPEPRSPGAVGSIGRRLGKKFSGYFSKGPTGGAVGSPGSPAVPLGIPGARARAASQGAAYGYSTATRARLASIAAASVHRGGLAASLARRRASLAAVDASAMGVQPGTSFGATIAAGRPSFAGSTADLSFAQRLVLANENAVTNIADLWVASAMNVDNEDVFESDTEEDIEDESFATEPAGSGFTVASGRTGASLAPSAQGPAGRRGSTASTVRAGLRRDTTPSLGPEELAARRASLLPGIFQNAGLRTPPALLEVPTQPFALPAGDAGGADMATIFESRPVSVTDAAATAQPVADEKPKSLWNQLPIAIIVQYALIALHTTTHDQVFLSYLVSPYESGGLNLNPGHFAQLIALMCLAQIVFQFYLYPNIGPPRGRFSHLAMFRIGSALFIPSYLTVTLYRVFASPDDEGNPLIMGLLAVSTAVRFAGNTFGYTAINILLNYMSPPELVQLSNGLAQSIVSLMRFVGPIAGGAIWSWSVSGNPGGYPLGFVICAAICGLAIVHTFFIR